MILARLNFSLPYFTVHLKCSILPLMAKENLSFNKAQQHKFKAAYGTDEQKALSGKKTTAPKSEIHAVIPCN